MTLVALSGLLWHIALVVIAVVAVIAVVVVVVREVRVQWAHYRLVNRPTGVVDDDAVRAFMARDKL